MRKYIIVYDIAFSSYRIAFRDPEDPEDTFYIEGGLPPIIDEEVVTRIKDSMNRAQLAVSE